EILGCCQWLAELQILACVPQETSIPIRDLADLAGVPETQLRRVVRLTATYGFLREPMANSVSHTPLSSRLLEDHALQDATHFIVKVAAPAAFHMSSVTPRFGAPRAGPDTAYNLALNTSQSFRATLQEHPRFARQWSAYLHHGAGLQHEDQILDVILRLNWTNLGGACIVEVGARSISTARSLAENFSSLRLVVQIDDSRHSFSELHEVDACESSGSLSNSTPASPGSRILVTPHLAGQPQPISDGAVYILHLDAILRSTSRKSSEFAIQETMRDYSTILRATGAILLIVTACLLPEPGSIPNSEVEATARTRDLNLLQLADEGEMEMSELLSIIETMRDATGKLVVTTQLRAQNGLVVALVVKH
ncbi:hypothetical protein M406DRAFT_25889, partial [Cryphonectria parasitica EP155]